jgi:insertion element IS1 protein InsB
MNCKYCNGYCIKRGFQNKTQKYQCKTCKHYQQKEYVYKICTEQDNKLIAQLNNEGMSISSIGRITGISKANVVNRIKKLVKKIIEPQINERHQEYEADELYTFIGAKKSPCYIMYAVNKISKQVVNIVVGARTKENLFKVIESINQLSPKRIFTDRLNIYPTLIPATNHVASAYKINHIERFNLTLRTHLKRLSRKTICFSKSREMLENCLRIYLWNKT